MERNYLEVTDDQVIEKTGRRISEWIKILDEFQASKKRSNDTVTHLHQAYGVVTHRARALITYYLKQKKKNTMTLENIRTKHHKTSYPQQVEINKSIYESSCA